MTLSPVYGRDCAIAEHVGGKAAALATLAAKGFDVPPFVTIAHDAFTEDGMTRAAKGAIEVAISEIGPGPFAVRSSGREEDGAAHSHAGQFLSLLNVAAPDVPTACLDVWRSGSTDGLRAYRRSKGLDLQGGGLAVIVQRMVPARAAGVAFSADPVSGRHDRIVVSATSGLGDRLVSGEIDGESYVVDKETGKLLSAPTGGVLTDSDLAALNDVVRRIEAAFERPQDIEWAFEGARLWILQARPITSRLQPAAIADPQRLIFDNSNIVESYPGLVSPLTYSFAAYVYARVYRMFMRILGVNEAVIRSHASTFDNMLARIDGRVYYNLISWYRALALLPGFSINRSYMEQMMGVGSPLPADIAERLLPPATSGVKRLKEWTRVARIAGRLVIAALRIDRSITAFHFRLRETLRRPSSELDAMPLSALAAEYRRIEAGLLDRWDAPLVNDFLCMIAFGASRKLVERWAGAEGIAAHNDIMIGQGDIISAEPAQRIARMGALAAGDAEIIERLRAGDSSLLKGESELAEEIRAYIDKFGDRCTEELKLESLTLEENPAPLFAAIAAAARLPARASRRHAGGLEHLHAILAHHPVKRLTMRQLVGWAKARVRDRENLRFERTRIFGRARRLFLAIGRQFAGLGLLERERDIFFLTVQEILGAIEGFGLSGNLRGLVKQRMAEQEAAAARPNPPERIEIHGAAALGFVRSDAMPPVESHDEATRHGTGCSAGSVTARARVIRDPGRESLSAGEILVASHTDPGWIAIFSNAAAIVVERGSLLSHSAIVARELGIPCVVGLKGATAWIGTGDLIEVDGTIGRVEKRDG